MMFECTSLVQIKWKNILKKKKKIKKHHPRISIDSSLDNSLHSIENR